MEETSYSNEINSRPKSLENASFGRVDGPFCQRDTKVAARPTIMILGDGDRRPGVVGLVIRSGRPETDQSGRFHIALLCRKVPLHSNLCISLAKIVVASLFE